MFLPHWINNQVRIRPFVSEQFHRSASPAVVHVTLMEAKLTELSKGDAQPREAWLMCVCVPFLKRAKCTVKSHKCVYFKDPLEVGVSRYYVLILTTTVYLFIFYKTNILSGWRRLRRDLLEGFLAGSLVCCQNDVCAVRRHRPAFTFTGQSGFFFFVFSNLKPI